MPKGLICDAWLNTRQTIHKGRRPSSEACTRGPFVDSFVDGPCTCSRIKHQAPSIKQIGRIYSPSVWFSGLPPALMCSKFISSTYKPHDGPQTVQIKSKQVQLVCINSVENFIAELRNAIGDRAQATNQQLRCGVKHVEASGSRWQTSNFKLMATGLGESRQVRFISGQILLMNRPMPWINTNNNKQCH